MVVASQNDLRVAEVPEAADTAEAAIKTRGNSHERIRSNWSREEIAEIYNTPVLELVYRAATVHRQFHDPGYVQQCTLLSIKTGACSEDCAYCSQSSRYKTKLKPEGLLNIDSVIAAARTARDAGSTRFCMGAAWREVKDNQSFEDVLEMVRSVASLDLEVCCTLGMLTEEQALRLKEAGLKSYNHNLDTSKHFYGEIVTTRTYEDRLTTLKNVRKAGIDLCCGGIVGLGESADDRIDLLHTLSNLPEHPESVPINALVPVKGTPLEDQPLVSIWEMLKMIATARIIMPASRVRLSAGRVRMTVPEQALCFMAGANSIFTGEKLLTTPNSEHCDDKAMFALLGLK
jgi:biotin synthase